MPISPCPECSHWFGAMVDQTVADGDVIQEFECQDCTHEWSKRL